MRDSVLFFLPGAKDRVRERERTRERERERESVSAPKNFAFANNVPHRVISASEERTHSTLGWTDD